MSLNRVEDFFIADVGFEKIPILQAFSHGSPNPAPTTLANQLNLFST